MSSYPHDTSQTLLGRLRRNPPDEASWNEFVDRYGVMILRWCRHWGLQRADAEDVSQNVLVQLARQMKSFEYDSHGRFRSWLKTVAYRAWCDFLADRQKSPGVGSSDAILQVLESPDARTDFLRTLDLEAERNLFEDAAKLVRLRVEPKTWQAFDLTAVQNLSGEDAARQLGLSPGSIYVARSRVTRMIRELIEELGGAM